MTAKEWNEKALSDKAMVELAEAMGLGEFVALRLRSVEDLGEMRVYEFENGDVYSFAVGRVRANVRMPLASFDIEIACSSIETAIEQARALGVADYVATLNA